MQIKSYEEAVKYLEGFIGKIRFRIDPEFLKHHDPLERMKILLSLLGNPQNKFSSILIGGTSGKGSTAYLISHILTTAGYKTGLTLSPHLQKINERIQINGKSISDGEFTKMVSSMVQIIELMKKKPVGVPSYFEIIIAMAFLYFVQNKVDIAVVEVGMGGEFDATNTLSPLVAVLTNVSLDHTSVLGGTVQKIAKTKAGIIKKYQISNIKYQINTNKENLKKPIVISGVRQPSVIKIVEERCKEAGAELFRLGKDFDYKVLKESINGTVFEFLSCHRGHASCHPELVSGSKRCRNKFGMTLIGKYQVKNASLAIEAVLQLEKFGFKVEEVHIRKALKTAFFPGRFEVTRCHPEFISGSSYVQSSEMLNQVQHDNNNKKKMLVLDGAHNPTKMKAFLTTLKKLFPKERKVFVVGFKFDKDIKKMLKQIVQVADSIIVTEFRVKTDLNTNASADALNIKNQILKIKNDKRVIVEKDSKKALDNALAIEQFSNSTIIVVTGSLYLVGEVRNML